MFQTIILIGNLGKEPEMRYTPSGQPVVSFSVATNRSYKGAEGQPVKETTWFRVTAWGKQAGIMARAGSNVVRFQIKPCGENTGKVLVLAEADETGESEIELEATVEGLELEIAFNVNFFQDSLEAIETKSIVLETNTHKTPAVIRPAGEEEYTYVLMPMHIDGK